MLQQILAEQPSCTRHCWALGRHNPEEYRKDLLPDEAYSLEPKDKQLSKDHRV